MSARGFLRYRYRVADLQCLAVVGIGLLIRPGEIMSASTSDIIVLNFAINAHRFAVTFDCELIFAPLFTHATFAIGISTILRVELRAFFEIGKRIVITFATREEKAAVTFSNIRR